MEILLLTLAWTTAITGLLLVADMITMDFVNRRADRLARCEIGRPTGARRFSRHRR